MVKQPSLKGVTLEMILTEYLCVTVGKENRENIQCSLFLE